MNLQQAFNSLNMPSLMPLFWRKQEKMELKKLLTPSALQQAIKTDPDGVRLLDCAMVPQPRPAGYKYGNFDLDPDSQSLKDFCGGHIDGAVHFDLSLATCPTDLGQFDHYPREIFERYVQSLGINSDHQLVLYGRGFFWAVYSSRVYWLFKSYGHKGGISLLDGGLDAWVEKCCPVTLITEQEATSARSKKGNWRAMTEPSAKTVTFQQLVGGANGVDISRCKLLDARTQAEFEGKECMFEPLLTAAHRAGAINICAMKFLTTEGTFRSSAEIRELVQRSGLVIPAKDKKLVTFGNSGMQAAMLATMLDIEYGSQIGDLCMYIGTAYTAPKDQNHHVGGFERRRRLAETFHNFKQTSLWAHVAHYAALENLAGDRRAKDFLRELEEYVADRNFYHSVDVVRRPLPALPENPSQPPSNGTDSSGTGGNTLSTEGGGWQDDEMFFRKK